MRLFHLADVQEEGRKRARFVAACSYLAVHTWLCILGCAYLAVHTWLCILGCAYLAVHTWLCILGCAYLAVHTWLCDSYASEHHLAGMQVRFESVWLFGRRRPAKMRG
jgi:hypothetical protein